MIAGSGSWSDTEGEDLCTSSLIRVIYPEKAAPALYYLVEIPIEILKYNEALITQAARDSLLELIISTRLTSFP